MKIQLTPLQNRLLAISLTLTVLLMVVASVGIPVWLLHRHYDLAIDEQMDKLIRYKRFAEQAPAMQLEISKLEAINPRRLYIKTSNPGLAAAEVQESVKQLIELGRGKLTSVQILPPKDEGKHRRISVSIQANVTAPSLQQVLRGLDAHEPFLFVDTLAIRAGQGRLYRPAPGVEPEFSLQMTLHGYAVISPS